MPVCQTNMCENELSDVLLTEKTFIVIMFVYLTYVGVGPYGVFANSASVQ